jgi:hypothetical protein
LVPPDDPIIAAADQRQRAEEMFRCAEDAGLPVVIQAADGAQALVAWAGSVVMFKSSDESSGTLSPNGLTEAEEAVIAEFMAEPYSGPRLVVDGVDYSEGYAACLAESSYVEPVHVRDPERELEVKQQVTDASNRWAGCARENGFPAIKDAKSPVIDDYQTYPIVLLPASITVKQIEKLAEVCPVLAQEEADRIAEAAASGEEVVREPLPEVGIDVPGLDGEPVEPGVEDGDEVAQQYAGVLETLYAASRELNALLEERARQGGEGG